MSAPDPVKNPQEYLEAHRVQAAEVYPNPAPNTAGWHPAASQSAVQGQAYPGPSEHERVYPAGDPVAGPVIDTDGVPDFQPVRERPTFKMGGEAFFCKIEIPALKLLGYAMKSQAAGENMTDQQALETTIDMVRLFLVKESADRLLARMDDEDNPVGMKAVNDLVPWLMEIYGMAPTEPSSSSAGSGPNQDDGQNSTESTPAGA